MDTLGVEPQKQAPKEEGRRRYLFLALILVVGLLLLGWKLAWGNGGAQPRANPTASYTHPAPIFAPQLLSSLSGSYQEGLDAVNSPFFQPQNGSHTTTVSAGASDPNLRQARFYVAFCDASNDPAKIQVSLVPAYNGQGGTNMQYGAFGSYQFSGASSWPHYLIFAQHNVAPVETDQILKATLTSECSTLKADDGFQSPAHFLEVHIVVPADTTPGVYQGAIDIEADPLPQANSTGPKPGHLLYPFSITVTK